MTALDTLPGVLLVAGGGALGAVARWGAGRGMLGLGLAPELATLGVNVVGCLCIGVLLARTADPQVRLLLGTGVLGGFTTFSTFAAEGLGLGGRPLHAAAYVLASVGLGLLACHLGQKLAAGGP